MKFKWFLGIDISKLTLDITIYDQGGVKKSKHIKIDNNINGFKELLKWLRKMKIDVKQSIFCMEHTGIYGLDLQVFFEEKGIFYSAVSPYELKHSLGISRGKNDKIDSYKISYYCQLHAKELKLSKLSSKTIRTLKLLLNERGRIVKMQTIEKQALGAFKSISSKLFTKRSEQRLKTFSQQIEQVENEIKTLIEENPEIKKKYNLAKSVIGIGLVNAVNFIVYTNNFEGFDDGRKYASYSGIAPFEETSGTSVKGKTRVSQIANKKIKISLTQAAKSAVQHDPELKIYYNRKKEEGKSHGTVMNAVKFKIILRVFAVVKRETPYVKLRTAG